jgi:hypothetical protein
METNKPETSPKKKMTLQEEIDSWQKEKWPPGFMKAQAERNLQMIEIRDKKYK